MNKSACNTYIFIAALIITGSFAHQADAQFANDFHFHNTVVGALQDIDGGTAQFPYGDFDRNEEPTPVEWYMLAIGDRIVQRQRVTTQNQEQQQFSGFQYDPYYAAYARSFTPRPLDYFVAPQAPTDDAYVAYFTNYQNSLNNTPFYSYSERLDNAASTTATPAYTYDFVYEPPTDLGI